MSAQQPVRSGVVVVPTYQERESLPRLLDALRASHPDLDVLVVDDASPDGTGALADERAAADAGISVLHRSAKDGLGRAYVAGFSWALERGYELCVQMDADGSHRVEDLQALLARSAEADVVLGSRWVRGGAVENWPLSRRVLSRGGNIYVRVLLGMEVRDATGGFRVWRSSALERLELASVESQGYCFQVDTVWRASALGMRVVEVPITFVERALGKSKMSRRIVIEALTQVTRWGVGRLWGRAQVLERSTQ